MNEFDDCLIESESVRRYHLARAGVPDGVAVTLLDFGAEETRVVSGDRLKPATSLVLSIGYSQLARRCFRHTLPTPRELENAIAVVEDELMKHREAILPESALFATGILLHRIAQVAGIQDNGNLGIDVVEATFERLAAIVLGRPAAQDAIPTDAEFAAALTILRELMHHLSFSSISVLSPD